MGWETMSYSNNLSADKLSEYSAAAKLPYSVSVHNPCQLCNLLLPIHNYHNLRNDKTENVSYHLLGLFVNSC